MDFAQGLSISNIENLHAAAIYVSIKSKKAAF